MTIAPHRGLDYAFNVLVNGDANRIGSAIADIARATQQDAHAALYLNVLLNQAGHAFFGSLSPTDQKMLGTVLARADLAIAAAYPAETKIWEDAAAKWRAFADKPLAKVDPAPDATRSRGLRGMFS